MRRQHNDLSASKARIQSIGAKPIRSPGESPLPRHEMSLALGSSFNKRLPRGASMPAILASYLNPALFVAIVMEEVQHHVPDASGDAKAVERGADHVVVQVRRAGELELGLRATVAVDAQADGPGFAGRQDDRAGGESRAGAECAPSHVLLVEYLLEHCFWIPFSGRATCMRL